MKIYIKMTLICDIIKLWEGANNMVIAYILGVFLLISAAFLKPNWLYAVLGYIAFGVFFKAHLGNWLLYALFSLGVALLIAEFYIPGFGIAGVLGIGGTAGSLYIYTMDIMAVLVYVGLALVIILLTSFVYTKLGCSISLSPALILSTTLHKEEGFSSSEDRSHLIDQKGKTITALRPVGRAEIDGEFYDVMSDVDMIASDTNIVVKRIEGSKIYVRKDQ